MVSLHRDRKALSAKAEMYPQSALIIYLLPFTILPRGLGEHIHNDHIARLIVHHKVEHVPSRLPGDKAHAAVSRIELSGPVFGADGIGLNQLEKAAYPARWYISQQLKR
jgi:hypothetical protein